MIFRQVQISFSAVLLLMLSVSSLIAAPVRIAAIFSQTGIAASHNAPLIQMAKLAVAEVNDAGGVLGQPLELVLLDNYSTPIGSSIAAEKAVQLQVTAVIGAHWSSHSLCIAPILQKAGIPMISPGSTNPKVTRIGDYIFRACFLDSFQGKAMARFAFRDLEAKKAAILTNLDESYSLMLAEYFKTSFSQVGGKILIDEGYRGKAVDFADLLRQVKRAAPDVLYIPGYTRDSGLLIRQAASMGIQTTFLGGDAWDEIDAVAKEALIGSYQSAAWHPGAPFEKSIHLQNVYRARFGTNIKNVSAPLSYDAVMLLVDAIRSAGTLDRKKIRDALASTKGFTGATGLITMDENGDPRNKEVIILRWDKDGSVYLKTITP
jgi:branched-chain amino acid transport system substrate-binding protein